MAVNRAGASLVIAGATILDGIADHAIEGHSIWIEGATIKAIFKPGELASPSGAQVIDGRGKYAIPGLMNANVHLLSDVRLENLARYVDRYEELIVEAAQVALKHGLTTVFDTWGPRRHLVAARDKINDGLMLGSRIFLAGNIVGFDGPFSGDFFEKAAGVASAAFSERVHAVWVENVGRRLMWLTPEEVATEVRDYLTKSVDFIKYGSNQHGNDPGAFLAFSSAQQEAIVEAAHRAGTTAQAHTHTVEGLRMAVDAGCDLIQHANLTGPTAIPGQTLRSIRDKQTGIVVFPYTERGLHWFREKASALVQNYLKMSDVNVRNLLQAGAKLVLATDGSLFAPEAYTDPKWGEMLAEESIGLIPLATGHLYWLRAMEEKGADPMQMLKAATINIATAYRKDRDLGSIESGKIADLLLLDKNPLRSADHYQSIHLIIKEGAVVDRDCLPVTKFLTKPLESLPEEQTRNTVGATQITHPLTWPPCLCGRSS